MHCILDRFAEHRSGRQSALITYLADLPARSVHSDQNDLSASRTQPEISVVIIDLIGAWKEPAQLVKVDADETSEYRRDGFR